MMFFPLDCKIYFYNKKKCLIFLDTFEFFILTIISVILLNSANGFYQNSIYGIAADFPWRFTNAIILGNNLCGSFVSLSYIIFKICMFF